MSEVGPDDRQVGAPNCDRESLLLQNELEIMQSPRNDDNAAIRLL